LFNRSGRVGSVTWLSYFGGIIGSSACPGAEQLPAEPFCDCGRGSWQLSQGQKIVGAAGGRARTLIVGALSLRALPCYPESSCIVPGIAMHSGFGPRQSRCENAKELAFPRASRSASNVHQAPRGDPHAPNCAAGLGPQNLIKSAGSADMVTRSGNCLSHVCECLFTRRQRAPYH
jgi:hypothetical protein